MKDIGYCENQSNLRWQFNLKIMFALSLLLLGKGAYAIEEESPEVTLAERARIEELCAAGGNAADATEIFITTPVLVVEIGVVFSAVLFAPEVALGVGVGTVLVDEAIDAGVAFSDMGSSMCEQIANDPSSLFISPPEGPGIGGMSPIEGEFFACLGSSLLRSFSSVITEDPNGGITGLAPPGNMLVFEDVLPDSPNFFDPSIAAVSSFANEVEFERRINDFIVSLEPVPPPPTDENPAAP